MCRSVVAMSLIVHKMLDFDSCEENSDGDSSHLSPMRVGNWVGAHRRATCDGCSEDVRDE
jgi:hypothetical protein